MCTSPNFAIYIKSQNKDEPGWLKFLPIHMEDNYSKLKERYGDMLLTLPCGKCEECRRDYATQWAVRCSLEASKYEYNWFITLTYDNWHLPAGNKLSKKDVQEFFDNLAGGHKKRSFKYWLAGEYGPKNSRPHYHLILFNYPIQDLKKLGIYKSTGNTSYESETIRKAWGKGMIDIQEAGENAAAYCAKYASKGGTQNFRPMMSKGIGLSELELNQDFINKYGYIQGPNGKKYAIPRYYYKKVQTEEAEKRKKKQIAKAKQKTAEHARFDHIEKSWSRQEALELKQKGGRSKV